MYIANSRETTKNGKQKKMIHICVWVFTYICAGDICKKAKSEKQTKKRNKEQGQNI